MLSPLSHINLFGDRNVEPSVTTFTNVETEEQLRIDPVNDLIIVSPFRDGKPLTLRRFREVTNVQAVHDPTRTGDQGVALARTAKDSFADRGIFGAPTIVTMRPNPATAATAVIDDGASTDLIRVTRLAYGTHANGPGITVAAGSVEGKKVTITSTLSAPMIGDNLGLLLSMQYTGAATAATVVVLSAVGLIDYPGQPTDAETVTVTTRGEVFVFEFDDDASVTGTNTMVTIAGTPELTYAALVAAIESVAGLTATQDTDEDRITIDAPDDGVVLATNAVGVTVTLMPPAARLVTVLDGDVDLDLPLAESALGSIDKLANYINNQLDYTASVRPGVNKFLASTGLDPLASTNVKSAAVILAGYNTAILDFINTRTRGRYLAEELGPRGEPDEATYSFAGGTTPPATITDWENALDAIEEGQSGGIILFDTDDTAVFVLARTWLEEMRSAGRWFRAFAGVTPGLSDPAVDLIAAGVDHERFRLAWQRPGIRGTGGAVEYLHPVFIAAAMAGGAAGNQPYENPLTNKRLRFLGVHENDRRTKTEREALIEAGLMTLKEESVGGGKQTVVTLAVTTSRDTSKRMVRIMSEIDTIEQIDQAVRDAFQIYKGRWTDSELVARARGTLNRVLQEFVDRGALINSIRDGVTTPAFQIISVTVSAGALAMKFQVLVGGELNHVDIEGFANYARIEDRLAEREINVQLAA
jgi:hypothetical protein